MFYKNNKQANENNFSGIEDDKEDFNSLEEEEIEQLLDLDSLQDIPEKDLKKYSVKLEKTIKNLKKWIKKLKECRKRIKKIKVMMILMIKN